MRRRASVLAAVLTAELRQASAKLDHYGPRS
jgi:hypothetical protein